MWGVENSLSTRCTIRDATANGCSKLPFEAERCGGFWHETPQWTMNDDILCKVNTKSLEYFKEDENDEKCFFLRVRKIKNKKTQIWCCRRFVHVFDRQR